MEHALYDEFGNYIGPEVEEDDVGALGYDGEDAYDEEGDARDDADDAEIDYVDEDAGEQRRAAARSTWDAASRGQHTPPRAAYADVAASTTTTTTTSTALMIPSDSVNTASTSTAVQLYDRKQYYPDAEAVYPEAEIVVGDEDTQPLEQPIIQPTKVKTHSHVESALPETSFDLRYLAGLMDRPLLVRHIGFFGHLDHGKTSLADVFICETHTSIAAKHASASATASAQMPSLRYLDTRHDEQARGLSIKSTPISLVLPSLTDKSYLLNFLDTPGHLNFSDEQSAAFRMVDGAVVVVDVCEGVMLGTERVLRAAVAEQCKIMVVLNKIDRLILELKITPTDAYHKLCHTLDEINAILQRCSYPERVSPECNNVCFASARGGFLFSLRSFAKMYTDRMARKGGSSSAAPKSRVSAAAAAAGASAPTSSRVLPAAKAPPTFNYVDFAKRLWGNVYVHSDQKFRKQPESSSNKRTFIQFILEPLYKLYSHTLSREGDELRTLLHQLGISLTATELKLDLKPLLAIVLSRFFGNSSGFVDMVVEHTPSPLDAARIKVPHVYTGSLALSSPSSSASSASSPSPIAEAMLSCSTSGPLMLNVVKLYARADGSAFDCFGRVYSGVLHVGDRVRVLGESYGPDDEEDQSERDVTKLWIYQGRYRIEVNRVTAGNWVLIEGIDASVLKTATVCSMNATTSGVSVFRPLAFTTVSTVKVAIEPLVPSELPKMLDALRKIDKSYPLAVTKVEESGEHVVLGTGELYLDCVLHDLRKVHAEIEIKVSDPVVRFCETVQETSSLQCFAETPNKANKLTMIAQPLASGIAEAIERNVVSMRADREQERVEFFQNKYNWDVLASRSIWAFGPDVQGPNVLVDDTLAGEVDKKLLYSVKDSVVQGFQWSCREGPLCDEPIRNVHFRLVDASIAQAPLMRARGQLIPTARRVAYCAFLVATPRLMEPINLLEIQAPADCISTLSSLIARRRGNVIASVPKPGTPLYTVHAHVPVMDAFGLESDLRMNTNGQAFGLSTFDHWDIVPGDPLARNITLRPLEPAPPEALAYEFVTKTRRRKGLAEGIAINKFFDDAMLLELSRQGEEDDMGASNGRAERDDYDMMNH